MRARRCQGVQLRERVEGLETSGDGSTETERVDRASAEHETVAAGGKNMGLPVGGSTDTERDWYAGMASQYEQDKSLVARVINPDGSWAPGGQESLSVIGQQKFNDAKIRLEDGYYNYYFNLKSAGTYDVTDPITGQRGTPSTERLEAQSITSRRLDLLRNMLSGGQQRGIGDLRRNLAQRGMLDSGSLGAGIGSIVGKTQGQLSEGTQAAAMGESGILLDLIRREKDRGFEREQRGLDRSSRENLMRLQYDLQRRNQPSGFEQFLSGVGGGIGMGLPSAIYGMTQPRNTGSER